ncbi:MAG: iron ABC transporter permease [Acetobacteraceae bacterium]|nr:iron ABC transporter permease [Acetobacteraceae bacterium]
MIVLPVLAAAGGAASLLVGAAGLGWPDADILWQIRLPRAVLALLCGAALGGSGAALQGLLRNRLADPGLLGFSGCASLGAVLAFYFGLYATTALALPLAALAGALAGAVLLLAFARRAEGTTLILAGVALASLASAALTLALALAPSPFALAEITVWLLGSLEDRAPEHVLLAGPPIIVGLVVLARTRGRLDALALGEPTAASLGVDPRRLARRVALGVALCVGGATAVAGSVGFVGLIVPNLLRAVLGERPSLLVLPAAFAGAVLLVLADIAVRLIPTAQELRLGVLTALLGAPVLAWAALRAGRA